MMKEELEKDEDRNYSSNDSIKRQNDNSQREGTPTSSQDYVNKYDPYMIQYYRNSNKSKKREKKVRFSDDDDDEGCNNVMTEWICYSDSVEGDEKKPLSKDGSKWYKDLVKDSFLSTGHLALEGNYQGDDDITHCIRGLEFKLPTTKSLEMKRNRRLMALQSVFKEQARQQRQQQQQYEIQRQHTNGFILALNYKQNSSNQQVAVVDDEKIAYVYAKACSQSRKLAMLFGIYDAKEAIRIYNGQKESLSVLICRRLLELDATNNNYSKTNELPPSEREVEENLCGKQHQQRRRRTRRKKETACMKDNNNTKLPSKSLKMTKRPKCLYLENIEEVLLSVLTEDSSIFPMNNNSNNSNDGTVHTKCDKRDKKQRNRLYFPTKS